MEASQRFAGFADRHAAVQRVREWKVRRARSIPAVGKPTAGPATDGASLRQTVIGLKFNGPDLPGRR